jgi:hypothetical protein
MTSANAVPVRKLSASHPFCTVTGMKVSAEVEKRTGRAFSFSPDVS